MVAALLPWTTSAGEIDIPHPDTYIPTLTEIEKHKAPYDDPRPYLKTIGLKQVLPPELYKKLTYDIEEMKDLWAELVGFRSPEEVGKIAPEIKPGKYTYKDKDNYPGLKELMWPDLYNRINPGGPPHCGNIPEFEIVPTRQYYFALPIAEASKRNERKTKLDEQGYPDWGTWESGYPFPKPSGKFKAQQIMYNIEKRYTSWGNNRLLKARLRGFTKDLKMDLDSVISVNMIRLAGRCLMPPYGWYDERAKKAKELRSFHFAYKSPRDLAGTVQAADIYLDFDKSDQMMLYLPSIRRIRKLSATDTQDPILGLDQIYDDNEGFMQKLSPTRYPYKYEVLGEREFLVPAPTWDGSEYISSQGLELRGLKFERRPMYILELTQLDPSYVYSSRIFYVDKETFNYLHIANHDRKGRLYRTADWSYSFCPEMGAVSWAGMLVLNRDHIDLHSGVEMVHEFPAFFTRKDISLRGLVKRAK